MVSANRVEFATFGEALDYITHWNTHRLHTGTYAYIKRFGETTVHLSPL